ncbi:unnamed protein product [Prorocentrum cordatum]|uniref:Uncharacterized protein n=1 Tax=Prorocentrum cordatum TaxID=2364126 RepID=A0ABN9PQQ0_9DINO|nr:unnamed protein product [Polarella glacialis]
MWAAGRARRGRSGRPGGSLAMRGVLAVAGCLSAWPWQAQAGAWAALRAAGPRAAVDEDAHGEAGRRRAACSVCSGWLAAAGPHAARAEAAPGAAAGLQRVEPYVQKLQSLRRKCMLQGEMANMFGGTLTLKGGFEGGAADALRETMEKGKKEVLEPLLADVTELAPRVAETLSGDQRAKAEGFPATLQKQLQDLDEDVRLGLFSEFTATATGERYAGGQAEQKIEEIGSLVQEFVELTKKGL